MSTDFGQRSKPKSKLSLSLNKKPDLSNLSSSKSNNPAIGSLKNANNLTKEGELLELQNLCQCNYEKPECSDSCQQAKKLRSPDSRTKCIECLHALLHASNSELHALRTENSELRQLLKSKNKAICVLRAKLLNEDLKGKIDSTAEKADYLILEKENQRLSSALEIAKGRLESMEIAWEDCFKRLKSDNEQLRANVENLQKALSESQKDTKESPTKLQNGGSAETESTTVLKYPKDLNCACTNAQQVHLLKEKVKELQIRELNQRDRADDLNISLEAYKIALEKQFSETQSFIRNLSKVLEAPLTNQDAFRNLEETRDFSACSELTKWIEQALKSALEENGERMRRMNGDSRKSVDLETSPPLPSSPSFNNSNFPSQQYSKHPVNDRSKGRKMSLRLQALSKALGVGNNPGPLNTRKASPLETLLLMVNEVIEKLTEGRMEEYIHNERLRLSQDKNSRPNRILIRETTV